MHKDDIARRFIDALHKELGGETMKEIASANRNQPDGYCASMDHCDADDVMSLVFHEVTGHSIDIQNREDVVLWNDAWDLAKTIFDREFTSA